METRILTIDDTVEINYLVAQSLGGGERESYTTRRPDPWPVVGYGAFENGRLHAMARIVGFETAFGASATLRMGGIADVGCLPASRGRGVARDCMLRCLEHMRDGGQQVSTLFPFSFRWYRQLGWEWTGEERRYAVRTEDLRANRGADQVRMAQPGDRAAIETLYGRMARRHRGMVLRSPAHWDRRLSDTDGHFTSVYVFDGAAGPEGYLTHRGWGQGRLRVDEFCADTPDAYRGLLAFLGRHAMQADTITWNAPSDDALWHHVGEPTPETRVGPVTQGRIVDAAAALEAWRPDPAAEGAVTVAIADDVAPWNHGVWRIECSGGRTRAERTKAEPQVEIDIRHLSQAFFGTPSLDTVRAAGNVVVRDEAGYAALRAALDGPPMWLCDHF